jgi:hypothetical protein
MKPIFLTVASNLNLMVIPDSEIHLDGHIILTYSYNIYLISRGSGYLEWNLKNEAELAIAGNTNYLGVIMSDSPGVYSYDATGPLELSTEEVNDLIKQIDHYRNTPSLWRN